MLTGTITCADPECTVSRVFLKSFSSHLRGPGGAEGRFKKIRLEGAGGLQSQSLHGLEGWSCNLLG